MTLTFNPERYSQLLIQYQPKLIRNESDNEKALAMIEELMHKKNRSLEENELYDLLITLIEKFERDFYEPGQASSPHSMLLFLMDQQDIKAENLIPLLGSEQIVLQIIENRQKIDWNQAQALGYFFKVEPSCLID